MSIALQTQPASLDWPAIATWAASCYRGSIDLALVNNALSGKRVCWRGKVIDNLLQAKHTRGLALNLPRIEVPLDDPWTFVGEYAFLPFDGESPLIEVDGFRNGSIVEFVAEIGSESALFPAVSFAIDDEWKRVTLKVSLLTALSCKSLIRRVV